MLGKKIDLAFDFVLLGIPINCGYSQKDNFCDFKSCLSQKLLFLRKKRGVFLPFLFEKS